MSSLPWVDVRKYRNREPIDAQTLNIPIEDLISRTDYLKRILDTFENPFSSVIISNLWYDESEVSVGDVVYIDTEDQKVHLAKSVVDAMDAYASYKSAFAIGIVNNTQSAVKCSVVIYGEIKDIHLSDITDDESDDPGVYYLSGRTAGKITKYPSGPQILIGTFLNDRVFLTPNHKSFAESHIHRSVKLKTQILTSGQISDPDAEGWVEEDGGYRYKMRQSSMLAKFWPPIPKECSSLVINGVELQSKNIDPDEGVYLVGDDTIHVDGRMFTSRLEKDKVTFHFIRGIAGNQGVVTSLRPKKGSPIRVTACGTDDPDTVGDLDIDVDLDINEDDSDEPGNDVYKTFDKSDHRFKKGPVVERIRAGNRIELSWSDQREGHDGQGVVTIGVSDESTGGEFDTTALQNAKQEMLGLFPYIKLPSYIGSVPFAFVAKFQVPVNLTDGEYDIRFYASIFGCDDSHYESTMSLGFTYNILPDLYGSDTTSRLNFRDDLIAIDEKTISVPLARDYSAYDPLLVTNDPSMEPAGNRIVRIDDLFAKQDDPESLVTVRPGYVVAVRFSRGSTGYQAPIGFMNMRWGVVPRTNN